MHSQVDWSIGAFADDADDHDALVPLALERASVALDRSVPPAEAVYVGDEPGDVRAGLAAGVRVVAVASGRSDEVALRQAGASVVLSGLDETEEFLKLLV
jgi:phosphoglycolate phosphatase